MGKSSSAGAEGGGRSLSGLAPTEGRPVQVSSLGED